MNYRITLLGFLIAGSLGACQPIPSQPAPTETEARGRSEIRYFSDTRTDVPAGPEQLRTTAGSIYLNNLDARIQSLQKVVEQREAATMLRVLLAQSLQHRGRVLGHRDDIEQALNEIDAVLRVKPDNVSALLTRAGIYSTFHRFQDALADLEHAERAGAKGERLDMARAGILIALGDIARAESLAGPWLDDNLTDLAFKGNRRVDEGRLQAADKLFSKAQAVYHDTNPVAASWLHVQHGVAFLRNGLLERAREFFAAAHARLPRYYLATEHLAETELLLGNYEHAAKLYRQVSKQTQYPIFYAKLAEAERALGNEDAAAMAEAKARAGFEAWLERHPEATWQHAAEYYLSRGNTGRARALARFNAELRQNIPSLLLLARAEMAAGNQESACKAWQRTLQSAQTNGLNPPEIAQHADQFSQC